MSCWVVPSIAAEFWGVSVQEVLRRIKCGELSTRQENGWTFVDVAPGSPELGKSTRPHPQTYTILSDAEIAALRDDAGEDELELAEATAGDEEPEEGSRFREWRTARRRTSRLRVAPLKMMAA